MPDRLGQLQHRPPGLTDRVAFQLAHVVGNGVDHRARRGAQAAGIEMQQARGREELLTQALPVISGCGAGSQIGRQAVEPGGQGCVDTRHQRQGCETGNNPLEKSPAMEIGVRHNPASFHGCNMRRILCHVIHRTAPW